MALLTQIGPATSEWLMRLDMLLLGLGMSHVFLPSQAAAFTTISPARTSGASAIFNACRQLGGAIGVALVTTVTAAGPTGHIGAAVVPAVSAYRYGFAAAAVVAVVGAAIALTVSDADAAPTMVRRPRAPERHELREMAAAGARDG